MADAMEEPASSATPDGAAIVEGPASYVPRPTPPMQEFLKGDLPSDLFKGG